MVLPQWDRKRVLWWRILAHVSFGIHIIPLSIEEKEEKDRTVFSPLKSNANIILGKFLSSPRFLSSVFGDVPAVDGHEPIRPKWPEERVGSVERNELDRWSERRERSNRRCDSYLTGHGPSFVVATAGRRRQRRPDQARYLSPLQHDELHHALRSTFLQRLRLLLRLSRLRAHRRRHRQVHNNIIRLHPISLRLQYVRTGGVV